MLYDEYLKCARKHLFACQGLLDSYNNQGSINDVWLELYYLSGYIIEAIVVYSVYKLYGWKREEDIQTCYNWEFTRNTKLDFFYSRTAKIGGSRIVIVPDDIKNMRGRLCVQGHDFQSIVKNLLESHPSMTDVPYIGDRNIDEDVRQLIDYWRPDVRYTYDCANYSYTYRGQVRFLNLPLDEDVIKRLINTCELIYKNISYV